MAPQPPPEVAALIQRSNRLGADPRNTNYAGGNTSVKGVVTDPVTGEPAELLWVKGSGGDLGTLTADGLAVLRLDRLRALTGVYPGVEREDEMVAAFDYCLHGLGGVVGPGLAERGGGAVHRHGHARAGGRPARRSPAPRLGDRVRHRGRRPGADQGLFRGPGAVGAVAAAGVPARPGHRRGGPGAPGGDRGDPRRSWDHGLGRDQRGVRGQLAGDHRRRPAVPG